MRRTPKQITLSHKPRAASNKAKWVHIDNEFDYMQATGRATRVGQMPVIIVLSVDDYLNDPVVKATIDSRLLHLQSKRR